MEPKFYTQAPLIILFFLLLCFSAQAVCKPRNLSLRYLYVPSQSPSSPPTKPEPSQILSSPRPTGPPPSRSPSPSPSPAPNPSSQPPQSSPPASSPSFLRHPSNMLKDSPRGNLFPNAASSATQVNPAIKEICNKTDYPDLCLSSLTPFLTPAAKPDPISFLQFAIKACTTHAQLSLAAATKLAAGPSAAGGTAAALSDCKDMYSDALDGLQSAMDAIGSRDVGTINSMLSGVVTDAGTCEDGFDGEKSPLGDYDDKLHKMASNCLAIASLIK